MHQEDLGLELGNEQRLRHEVAATARTNARGERLRGQRFRVLMSLVELCQGQATWSGSLAELAKAAEVSPRTAQAAMNDARDLQMLQIERRPGRSSIYTPHIGVIMDHHSQLAGESRISSSAPKCHARRRTVDPQQQELSWTGATPVLPAQVAEVTRAIPRSRSRILRDLGAELLPAQKIARVIALVLEFIVTFRRAPSADTPATTAMLPGLPTQIEVAPTQPAEVTPATCVGNPGKNEGMHDHEHDLCIPNSSMTMAAEMRKGGLGEKGNPFKTRNVGAGGKTLKRSDLNDPRELQRLWAINKEQLEPGMTRVEFFSLAAAVGPDLSVTGLEIRSPVGAFMALLSGQIIAGRDWRAIVKDCESARRRADGWIYQLDKPAATSGSKQAWSAGEEWVAQQRAKAIEKQRQAAVM